MKFGKQFAFYKIPEWSEYYLDYAAIKTILKFIDNRKNKKKGLKKLKKLKRRLSKIDPEEVAMAVRNYYNELKENNQKIEENKYKKEENKREDVKTKKEYKNNITVPNRGISALRRINQKIENYKKRITSRRKRRPKNKNQQYKSLSQLKKIGKHPFGVKQNKSIQTLPDVNKGPYQNFDFIDDI